jgi:acylphosphatase
MTAKRAIFEGRIQGVGFRYTVKQIAMGFDITGWIRNLADGNVELQIMGEEDEVEAFLKEIVEESTMARNIQNMYAHDIAPIEGIQGFYIA